jgi:hypothetical protein
MKMTGKERGDYIRELLFTLTSREEKVLRRYFGIQELERQTLEEIVKDDDVSSGQTRRTKNRGVREFRNRVIHVREILRDNHQGEFFNEKEDHIGTCDKLKEYVESVNPDLVHEDLPYHHSKFLDEFMLILIDGVDWS